MTSYRVERVRFDPESVSVWADTDPRLRNWPVVYTLDNSKAVYVGESLNVAGRFHQHLNAEAKQDLTNAQVIVDETFNKSVCLDLESYLIRLFAGDGKYTVLNRNEGITNADYYRRSDYQETFDAIFEELRANGAFTRSIPEIENSDLFKLSPFKALTEDQAVAVEDILEGLFADLEARRSSQIVIQGDPGTGKTVVAIFLMKLISDIQHADLTVSSDGDSLFSEFFVEGYPELLEGFRAALVVPQQSLRKSIQNVFKKTPGLSVDMVLSPFQLGESDLDFDLVIVDETHRLTQRASQGSGPQNKKYADINKKLFGTDDKQVTQLDWIKAKSRHQIFLLDIAQTVRPADVPKRALRPLVDSTKAAGRNYRLSSQHRVKAGDDYVGFIRALLRGEVTGPREFPGYDLRFFDDFSDMRSEIRRLDGKEGKARLVAGYAWPWASKNDKAAIDIELDGEQLQWNRTAVDWVNSSTAIDEMGCIHTTQGYDLNYAGVVIGRDLFFNETTGRIGFDRANYFDQRGKENNKQLGIEYSDEDLLEYVRNIYTVLLTRGIRGTFVYVCDPALRARLRQ